MKKRKPIFRVILVKVDQDSSTQCGDEIFPPSHNDDHIVEHDIPYFARMSMYQDAKFYIMYRVEDGARLRHGPIEFPNLKEDD